MGVTLKTKGDEKEVTNIRVFDDFINFAENVSKTSHSGICDLKYVPRSVTHIRHPKGQSHERCLPKPLTLGFYKNPVKINSLKKSLPDFCCAVRIKKKNSPLSEGYMLFQSGVDEKLIRKRTAHVSNALYKYEKASEGQVKHVGSIFSADQSSNQNSSPKEESKNEFPVKDMAEEKRVEKNFSIFEYVKSTCVKTWFDRAKMLTVLLRNPHYVISFKNFQDQLGRRSLLLQAFPTLWQDIMDVYRKDTHRPFSCVALDLHPNSDDDRHLFDHLLTHEGCMLFLIPSYLKLDVN
ncbi:hypothetical protein pdam_00024499 [Pocillopora damicornis]|uniref:Uncharacterized protein n=1 Tax=Pocillopora damicornis TaxID=46731 RepID=A0A3M6V0J9_POCDA|nr:hypothetical protein pdam_00024499 [Pocillopora damicornis]